uniref:Uncharacterized protein n=1 Tax=Rhizophora mucronata TaxID=61149 RepID=A0A2P2IRX6_RHIMU
MCVNGCLYVSSGVGTRIFGVREANSGRRIQIYNVRYLGPTIWVEMQCGLASFCLSCLKIERPMFVDETIEAGATRPAI